MATSKLDSLVARSAGADEPEVSRDTIFSVLSNRRRRWVLHFLKQHDGQRVSLRTLVDTVSAWEYDTTPEDLSWRKRKRVYTALRQSHLPKLADVGVIEYDRQRGEVALTEAAEEYHLYLEYVPKHDIPWGQYYLGLTGIGAAITTLAWISFFPFAELSGFAVAAILVGMFGISGAVHAVSTRRQRLGSEGPP